jgi:signal transduction histidine kinase
MADQDRGRDEGVETALSQQEQQVLRRVRIKLALWSGAITLAAMVILGVVIYGAVDRSLSNAGTGLLEARAESLTPDRRPFADRLPEGGFILGGPGSGTFTLVADGQGRTMSADGAGRRRVPEGLPLMAGIEAARDSDAVDIRTATIADGTPVRVLTQQVRFRGEGLYLQIVGDRSAEQSTLGALVVVLVIGGALVLVVASAAGAAFASRALVPIRRSLVAQRSALRRQREFAADASHELRTPLTVIRASVDDLQRHAAEPVASVGSALVDIRDEVDQMTGMVDDLLLLARSDSGEAGIEHRTIDLADVAVDGASSLSGVAGERGVSIAVDPAPTTITGDPARLRRLTVILVDNAIRHAPSGTEVGVRIRPDGDQGVLVVEDDGPGIPPSDLARVFDRFYRAAGAQGHGTGLGLAIASTIAQQHGGTIDASNRTGGGARFTVRLPSGPARGPGGGS